MITIGIPKITKQKKRVRLSCEIEINDEKKTLWLEIQDKYAGYLIKDRCDAFLIAMLPVAIRNNKDIVCLSPVSEELLHNIKAQLIPALAKCGNFYKTRISADIEKHPIKNAGAISTGLSLGINSMHILEKYIDSEFPHMNLTHLCIHDMGGGNTASNNESKDSEQIKKECLEKSFKLADELEIPYIYSTSNLSQDFNINYSADHIYYNLFPIFALQKLFKLYYYSSSKLSVKHFSIKNADIISSSNYEVFIHSVLSTTTLKILTVSPDKDRLEKTADIIHFDPAQKYLHVCDKDSVNCNKCTKCIQTMLALDGLDRLDYFSQVFDVDYYNKNKRLYVSYLEKCHLKNNLMTEPVYQLFDKRKMLPASIPNIYDDNINFNKQINTSSLIVKNLSQDRIIMDKRPKDYFAAVGFAKILTTVIALESGKTQMVVNIPPDLIPGIVMVTIYDLINILMITQSNRIVEIIADIVCGSSEEFVELMNQKSREIKAYNTHYASITALGADSYTTAEDALLLMEYCLKNSYFQRIFCSKSYLIVSGDTEQKISTRNPLLIENSKYYLPECVGSKFGMMGIFANNVVIAQKDNDTYLAVLMGIKEEGNSQNRFADAFNIINTIL